MKCKCCNGSGKTLFLLITKGGIPKLIDTKHPCAKCGGSGKEKLPAFRPFEKRK